jgi:DNA-binding NtrC family response regulator
MSKDRNRVLVVDDDPGMLRGVQRLLRQHAYEPILFSSAEAFKNHTDFDRAVCVVLDINLNDGSGIELRLRLKADGVSVAGYLHERDASPFKQSRSPRRSLWSRSRELAVTSTAGDML